jgi:hypothetical protein
MAETSILERVLRCGWWEGNAESSVWGLINGKRGRNRPPGPILELYYHVSGVPWLIITGSGLDVFTPSLQLQSIITAHSQWLPKTRSIPYWNTSVFHCDWLGCYLRIGHLRNTKDRWRRITSEWTLSSLNEWLDKVGLAWHCDRRSVSGAPSLTRGRVSLLYMLLALASAVFLGSE